MSGQAARLGFTLAEVLITLGIIGVVAALTLPSLINKYREKQLRTVFMRSSSIIQNALNQTAIEFGYNNIKELNNICGSLPESETGNCRTTNQETFNEINKQFISNFISIKLASNMDFYARQKKAYNYSGKTNIWYVNIYGSSGGPYNKFYYLPDGSVLTGMLFFQHGKYDGITFSFDTNGPERGPNRYGYDIFIYNTGTWYKLCTKKQDGSTYNGRGCYDYALKDVNPDDSTKGYWDSLY